MKFLPYGLVLGELLLARALAPCALMFALLTWSGHAQPVNDSFANRTILNGTSICVFGSNVGATREVGEPDHAGEYGDTSIWWSWTAPLTGSVELRTSGSGFDTLLGVYIGSAVASLREVASNDEDPEDFLYHTSRVEFDVVAGQSYEIAVDGFWGDVGTVTLQLAYITRPVNDMFANRIVLAGTNIVVTGSNAGASREPGEPYHADTTGDKSIWWSWTAPFTGTATICTAGSSFDTLLGVYLGSTLAVLTEVASNDEGPSGDSTSQVEFDAVAGQSYQIAVDGYYGLSGTVRLQVQLGPTRPPRSAPAWTLLDPNGQTVSSSSFAGKVVLLNFWTTWCGSCLEELPDLVALQDKYGPDGLVIVGVDMPWSGDNAQVVQSFLATHTPAINYQVVLADNVISQNYGSITSVPRTFIIDRRNFIRKTFVGSRSLSTFEQQVVPLLYGETPLVWERNGNQASLRWPVTPHSFTLESTPSLNTPAWTPWPTAPTVQNGTNTQLVPPTEATRYFRLRMAY